MKKCIYKKIAGAVFAAFLLSFVTVSCDKPTDTPKNDKTEEDKKEEDDTPEDADGETIHKMILPSGTGVEINAWEKAADALEQNLPDFVTGFTEDDYKTLSGATNRTAELKAAVKKAIDNNSFAGKEAKNVIIIFGDGMGESHLLGARHYYGDLIMDMLPYHAPVNHDCYPKPGQGTLDKAEKTTDSSAGGTAITTGFKTRYGYIGLDGNGTEVKNLAELAREKGMLVGNVTNDHMGDATPADVSIHAINRDYQNQIYGKLFFSSPDIAMGSDYGYSKFIQEKITGNSRTTLASLFNELDADTRNDLQEDEDYSDPEVLEKACKEASLNLWYEANATNLQKWAIQMLKIYDNKVIPGTTYDLNNWSADRNMHSYSSFTKLMSAVQNDYSIRPISSYEYKAKYTYDESKGQTAKKFGYKLGYGKKNITLPSYPEMVAATLSVLDHKAKAKGDCGFYCLIENTCSDGWGHAKKPYDCLNEVQCFDEGVAIALKYVLENPDTLLVITADHETGEITYKSNWENNYKRIISQDNGHSSEPVPVIAFGAKSELWNDYKREDTTGWTATDWAKYVAGTREGTDYSYQNRETGIRIGKAMGFDKYGDLNGNGVLDPDTESDSVISNKLPE